MSEEAMARARKFLAQSGIDSAAPIHREDAAPFHGGFRDLQKGILGICGKHKGGTESKGGQT